MATKSGGQRKLDRCKRNGQNSAYKAERRHQKSHVRRIERRLARYSTTNNHGHHTDRVAQKALELYRAAL